MDAVAPREVVNVLGLSSLSASRLLTNTLIWKINHSQLLPVCTWSQQRRQPFSPDRPSAKDIIQNLSRQARILRVPTTSGSKDTTGSQEWQLAGQSGSLAFKIPSLMCLAIHINRMSHKQERYAKADDSILRSL